MGISTRPDKVEIENSMRRSQIWKRRRKKIFDLNTQRTRVLQQSMLSDLTFSGWSDDV